MIWEIFKEALPEKINVLWRSWGIEFLVLVSFVCQVILTFNGSRRRHTPGYKLRLSVWFAYLLAAKVATVVLGKLTTIDIGHTERNTHTQVQALLAPLMFMQIGNPDTITAYSIEDNQLGVRQVFSMVIQVAIMFYILIRSWTDSKTSFLYLPMSLAGIIKYGETSWALISALHGNLGFTSADFIKYHEAAELFDKLPQVDDNVDPQAKLILRAYYRFCCLKPHVENWLYYPPTDCDPNKLYIDSSKCDYEEVFKITDSELGFMYDVLYTKLPVIYTRMGLILRLISFFSLIATLCGFSVLFKDAFVYNISVGFIHCVLIASVILEIYQILRLPFSDWAIVQLIRHDKTCPIIRYSLLRYLARQSATWKRWSNKMGQFNLLDFCMKSENMRISRIEFCTRWGLDMKLRKYRSWKLDEVHSKVKQLVVEELKEIEKIKEHGEFTERGKWTIERYKDEPGLNLNEQLKKIILERSFDKSIVIWHITTNILFHTSEDRDTTTEGTKREAIMNLSNYMMYLLATRSHVLSTTTGEIIFDHSSRKLAELVKTGNFDKKKACDEILLTPKQNHGHAEDEEESKAERAVVGTWKFLEDVRKVTNMFRNITSHEKRWELLGSMWVEMLGYAATNCEMEYHSQHIRQGGELITHVWLLIAHNITKYGSYDYNEVHQDEEAPATSPTPPPPTSFSSTNSI